MTQADTAHMGTNPVTGQMYDFPGFDPNQPNGHLTILGSPRSGRSTAAALRILRRGPADTAVIIIDADGSHNRLVQDLAGTTLRPGQTGQALNPFAWERAGRDAETAVRKILVPKLQLLTHAVLQMAQIPPTTQTKQFTGNALARLYQKQAEDPGQPVPTIESLITLLQNPVQEPGPWPQLLTGPEDGALTAQLAHQLQRFLDSPEATLVDTDPQSTLPRITSFDLSHLDSAQRALAATLCLQAAWTATLQDPEPRLLVIDDTGPLANANGSGALATAHSQARSCKLAITTVIHDSGTFLAQPGNCGLQLIQNSAATLLLPTQEDEAADLQHHLGVAESSETGPALNVAGPGHGLLIQPWDVQTLVRINPSAAERDQIQ